jgi:hypothetical protein
MHENAWQFPTAGWGMSRQTALLTLLSKGSSWPLVLENTAFYGSPFPFTVIVIMVIVTKIQPTSEIPQHSALPPAVAGRSQAVGESFRGPREGAFTSLCSRGSGGRKALRARGHWECMRSPPSAVQGGLPYADKWDFSSGLPGPRQHTCFPDRQCMKDWEAGWLCTRFPGHGRGY